MGVLDTPTPKYVYVALSTLTKSVYTSYVWTDYKRAQIALAKMNRRFEREKFMLLKCAVEAAEFSFSDDT